MATVDTAANLDRLQAQLEDSIDKLKVALKHWQTYEAEYEGLKEDLQALPQPHDGAKLVNDACVSRIRSR